MAEQLERKCLEVWGEKLHDGVRYAKDWSCPQCGRFDLLASTLAEADDKIKFAIGFSPDTPRHFFSDTVGALIFQCPSCQCKFWIHISMILLDTYSELSCWRKPKLD